MEEAEAVEELRESLLLVRTAGVEVGVTDRVSHVGLEEILSETRRRLIRHLHTILENCHWEL
jgi:hypothetical protein